MKQIVLAVFIPFLLSCGSNSNSFPNGNSNPFFAKRFYSKADYAEFDWTYGTKMKGDYSREVNQYNSADQKYFFVEKWLSTSGEKYEMEVTVWVPKTLLEWDFNEVRKILDQCVAEGRVEIVETGLGKIEACQYQVSTSPKIIKWLGAVPLGIVKEQIYHDDGHVEEKILRAARYGTP